MALEIERKFLVQGNDWKRAATGLAVVQGYIVNDPERSVRVRMYGNKAFLTIKLSHPADEPGSQMALMRSEFEYEIPTADAQSLLAEACGSATIAKTRWQVQHFGHMWEIDEFHEANSGLVVAEIELSSEDERFARPTWLGPEVTDDPRYINANLIRNPYSTW